MVEKGLEQLKMHFKLPFLKKNMEPFPLYENFHTFFYFFFFEPFPKETRGHYRITLGLGQLRVTTGHVFHFLFVSFLFFVFGRI